LQTAQPCPLFPSTCRWATEMLRIALCLPVDVEDRIASDATYHGHTIVVRSSSAQELASRIDVLRPDVVIAAASERHLTPSLLAVCDDAGVRIVALIGDDRQRRHAATIGLLESVPLDSGWPVIEATLTGVRPGPAAARTSGMVIAVWGPAGAPGRTTLAINIAAEIAAAGFSVVLGDVDTHSGAVAPALGMLDEAPGFAAACRLAGSDGLTRLELERIGQRYSSAHADFWVLTGIGRPSRWPELTGARVAATIAECRRWVDFTVLDTGFSLESDEEISSDIFAPRRNAASITALREADRIVAVGAADPVGIARFLRAHVDLVETVASGRVIVAMNKLRAGAIGVNPAGQISQTLYRFGGIDSVAMIPFDQAGMDAALLSGKTLADASPRSAALSAIRAIVASRLLPATPERRPRRREGRVRRLLRPTKRRRER